MEELSGIIKTILYRSRDSGWTVLELTTEDGTQTNVVGVLPQLSPGEQARLLGMHTVHPKYGPQFKAQSCEVLAPSSMTAMEQYLASGLIKGVGPATAKSIVSRFGMETMEVLEHQPDRLREIGGIGPVRAKTIAESFREQRDMRESMLTLQNYGLSVKQAMALHRIFGDMAVKEIEKDPYATLLAVDGIGFRTADTIALGAGVEADSAARMEAGVVYVLQWARQEGHTCLPRDKVVQVAAEKVLFAEPGPVERALDELILTGKLVYQLVGGQDMVFLPALYHLEANAARQLLSLAQPPLDDPTLNISTAIASLEKELHVDLAPLQKKAVLSALTEGAMVITGGPGTGKTTILRFIIRIMERLSLDFALCAPTGRAAKRMSEATGAEALTIHRLLECGMDMSGETRFGRNADNPLFYDMIVVDEMSMVDAALFSALLSALPEGTRLVMVGDADQLPSVGAGNVLLDIINSETLPVICLTEIFRQAERSSIVLNAHRINNGSEPILNPEQQDFSFEAAASEQKALHRLLQLMQDKGSPLLTSDPLRDVQVLSPMKKGLLGVHHLNALLQQALNPAGPEKAERQFGDMLFREGDKVMQIRNNYRQEWLRSKAGRCAESGTGVYNGDLGTLYEINTTEQTVSVLFDDERLAVYPFSQLEELDLAYCISIHKSQGSEFPIVLLPLLSGPPLLMTRRLLYTAVTRARHQVYLLGSWQSVLFMAENHQQRKRYSALCHRLTEYAPVLMGQ